MYTIANGGDTGARMWLTIWNCFTPTAIGRSIVRVYPWIKPGLRWRRRLQRLEPYAVKVACTVLRGGGDVNVSSLPDPSEEHPSQGTPNGRPAHTVGPAHLSRAGRLR